MCSCKKLRMYGCQDLENCWGVRQRGNVKINPRVLVAKLNGWCFRSAGMKRARWTLRSTDAATRGNSLVMLHPVDLGIKRSHQDLPQQKLMNSVSRRRSRIPVIIASTSTLHWKSRTKSYPHKYSGSVSFAQASLSCRRNQKSVPWAEP